MSGMRIEEVVESSEEDNNPVLVPVASEKAKRKQRKRKVSAGLKTSENIEQKVEQKTEVKMEEKTEKESGAMDVKKMEIVMSAISLLESKQNVSKAKAEELGVVAKKIESKKKSMEKDFNALLAGELSDADKLVQLKSMYLKVLDKWSVSEQSAESHRQKESNLRYEHDNSLKQLDIMTKRFEAMEKLCRKMEETHTHALNVSDQLRLKQQEDFSKSVQDISDRLERHNAGVVAKEEENNLLREKIGQFLKLEQIRQEQSINQEKKIELEMRIYEEKLNQSKSLAEIEAQKFNEIHAKWEESMKTNNILATQLTEWQQRFTGLSESMQQYSDMANQYKTDATKWVSEIKRLQQEKKSLENALLKANKSADAIIVEKDAAKQKVEKLQSQNSSLADLCRQLKLKLDQEEKIQ